MTDVICLGEALIDLVSSEPVESIVAAKAFVPSPGGSPANAAAAISRLGVSTAFFGKVGDDPFGHYLASILQGVGVDTTGLCFSAEARTALAFVALDKEAQPDYVFYRNPSADMLYEESEVDWGRLLGATLLHTGSIFFASDPSRSTALAMMRRFGESGGIVSLDPNVRLSIWGADEIRRVMREAIGIANIVKLSEEDLAVVGSSADPEAGSIELLQLGASLVVVTKGEKGCFCRTKKAAFFADSFAVDAVDTTGAGDAFVGGLVAALLSSGIRKEDLATLDENRLRPIIRVASANGALTTTARGAIPSLPDRKSLREFLLGQGEAEAATILG